MTIWWNVYSFYRNICNVNIRSSQTRSPPTDFITVHNICGVMCLSVVLQTSPCRTLWEHYCFDTCADVRLLKSKGFAVCFAPLMLTAVCQNDAPYEEGGALIVGWLIKRTYRVIHGVRFQDRSSVFDAPSSSRFTLKMSPN